MTIISLVPSITETLVDFGLDESQILGRTKFCIHPKPLVSRIRIIGGTKNPRLDKIISLKPDLIIANKEENRKEDIEILRQSCEVLVTDISNIEESYEFIKQLGEILNRRQIAEKLISDTEKILIPILPKRSGNCAYLIWKNPLMSVGSDTFIHDILVRLGFRNLFDHEKRYPEIRSEDLKKADIIFLSSEPFPFAEKHLKEFSEINPNAQIKLVDGEFFSWYGSRISKSGSYFPTLLASLEKG